MSKERQDPPNWWPSELNNDWGQYIPKDIQESLTGRQKTWCKAFAEAYHKSKVDKVDFGELVHRFTNLTPISAAKVGDNIKEQLLKQ